MSCISCLSLDIGLFIIGLGLISWTADILLDELEDLVDYKSSNGFLLAFILLGVDLEEFVASISAAFHELPEIAIGNLIGNTIISLTFIFGITILFFHLDMGEIQKKLIWLFEIYLIILAISLIYPILSPYCGTLLILLYFFYVFRQISTEGNQKIPGNSSSGQSLDQEVPHETKNTIEGTKGKEEFKKFNWIRFVAKMGFGSLGLWLGAELFLSSTASILSQTSVSESFLGTIIIAAGTNIEEYFLLIKSIKRKKPSIGLGAMFGKVSWNLGFSMGLSLVIIGVINSFSFVLVINLLILALIVLPIYFIAQKKTKFDRFHGIILLVVFIIFLSYNLLKI